jgi:hypothetical protein
MEEGASLEGQEEENAACHNDGGDDDARDQWKLAKGFHGILLSYTQGRAIALITSDGPANRGPRGQDEIP